MKRNFQIAVQRLLTFAGLCSREHIKSQQGLRLWLAGLSRYPPTLKRSKDETVAQRRLHQASISSSHYMYQAVADFAKKKSKEERWFDGFIGVGLILKAVSQLPPAQWAAIPVQRGNDDKQQISFYDKQLMFVCPEMMISGRLQLIVCWVLTRKSHLLFCYFLNSL